MNLNRRREDCWQQLAGRIAEEVCRRRRRKTECVGRTVGRRKKIKIEIKRRNGPQSPVTKRKKEKKRSEKEREGRMGK